MQKKHSHTTSGTNSQQWDEYSMDDGAESWAWDDGQVFGSSTNF